MTRFFRVACLLTFLVAATTASGAGLDPTRLERIGAAIEAEVAAGRIPGAVALVAQDGDVVFHRSYGHADIALARPMQNDAIFRIASMTKAVTSVGVMMLYERGHFLLNDPVSKFIPGFQNPTVAIEFGDDGLVSATRPAAREIRIVDLLSHSSGISYLFLDGPLTAQYRAAGIIDGLTTSDTRLADVMERLAAQPLLFDPGERFEYGLNTDVLGYLIEVISGKALDRFFAEEIFAPLGMEDTHFYLPDAKAGRLATLYAEVDGELIVSDGSEGPIDLDDPDYPVKGAKAYFSGGAGLSSTAQDYFRFVQMLANDGELDGKRLLGRKSVELMRAPRLLLPWSPGASFGLGFQVTDDLGAAGELGSAGAYSWGGIFNTSFWIDPDEGLVGVVMTQVLPTTSTVTQRFRTLTYQALK